jgi:peptidoglycan/xylan/chitin deacetylase (PgdA/CDA1 family)
MFKLLPLIAAMSFATSITSASAGSVAAPYEIATWRGFRAAAVSYTFDDDLANQYAKAVPMFDAKGFKLTLFTVTKWLPGGDWTPVQNAAAHGHEIASHTVTHPHLGAETAEQVSNELANSRIAIESNVPGQKGLTLAYPYCEPPVDFSIVSSNYIAARGCSGRLVPANPPDFLNISSFVCGSLGLSGEQMNSRADAADAANAWCVYLIHAIDDDKGYSPIPSAELQATLDHMSASPEKFWVETFGNVVRYIRERNAASVTETFATDSRIVVSLTDDLDNSIYNYPVTLRRPLPVGWTSASVTQNGKPVAARVIPMSAVDVVTFDAIPNGGEIVILKGARSIAPR